MELKNTVAELSTRMERLNSRVKNDHNWTSELKGSTMEIIHKYEQMKELEVFNIIW